MICFVGAMPPPTHGMSAINAAVVAALTERTRVRVIDVNPGSLTRGGSYTLKKAFGALAAVPRIVAARGAGARVLYGSVDDALGGAWTALFALTGRLLGMRVFLHHHSYRYLVRRTRLMRMVTRLAGPHARHIVLSRGMGDDLRCRYPAVRETIVVPNQVADAPSGAMDAPRDGVTIGMLANLTFGKGLKTFVETLEASRAAGLLVRAILAGPVPDAEERAFLDRALERNAGTLEWRGPVSGSAKEDFFAAIDLFVFPTQYPAEAYPLVVLEALLRHRPVIATPRGCLPAFAERESAQIIPEADFTARAATAIGRHAEDRAGLVALKRIAGEEGAAINADNAAARAHLIDTLVAASA